MGCIPISLGEQCYWYIVQGSAQTIFSGGNLVSLGVCIFAMYLYTPPQSRLPFC